MYYGYDLILVKPKLNKIKVIIIILILIAVVAMAILGGIQFAKYKKQKQIEQENIRLAKLEEERIAEEKRQEELRIKAEQERIEGLKNLESFSEEQMQAIENIYSSEEKRVFLTFDDGPTTTVTPLILDLLKEQNIKATFFVLGGQARRNPDLIKREYDEGHYIANHGYSHKYSQIYANIQNVLDEYNYTDQCIQEAIQNPNYHSKVFRFPGGSVGGYYKNIKSEAKQYLRDNGIVSLDWNALTKDAEGAHTKESIMENLVQTVAEKQSVVVLMHDAYDKILTYETLPDVIQFFKDNGYTFKNLYDIV